MQDRYVVFLRTNLDDVPLRMFKRDEKAIQFAEKVRKNPCKYQCYRYNVFELPDNCTVVGVAVVAFYDGHPTSMIYDEET